MTYQPGHSHPHTRFARACARLSRGLAWVYDHTAGVFHYLEDWAEATDDNGENISDDLPDVAGRDGWPEPDDGRTVAEAVRDAEAAEDGWPGGQVRDGGSARSPADAPAYEAPHPPDVHLPGETAQPVPPRQVHHQAVLLRDGTLLMKTPGEPPAYNPREIDDTIVSLRPEPRSGAAAWATQLRRDHRPPPAWVQRILDAPIGDVRRALQSPNPDMYLWQSQQRRALAAA